MVLPAELYRRNPSNNSNKNNNNGDDDDDDNNNNNNEAVRDEATVLWKVSLIGTGRSYSLV